MLLLPLLLLLLLPLLTSPLASPPPPSPRSLNQLQTSLQTALRTEDYSSAAKLRDEIKSLYPSAPTVFTFSSPPLPSWLASRVPSLTKYDPTLKSPIPSFPSPTLLQSSLLSSPFSAVALSRSVTIHAPPGSGKTLAAYLHVLTVLDYSLRERCGDRLKSLTKSSLASISASKLQAFSSPSITSSIESALPPPSAIPGSKQPPLALFLVPTPALAVQQSLLAYELLGGKVRAARGEGEHAYDEWVPGDPSNAFR